MNRPLASYIPAAVAALYVMMFCNACKTVRTEKWRKGTAGMSDMEARWTKGAQKNRDEINSLRQGDEDADYTHSDFDKPDVKTKNNLFSKKYAEGKRFRTKDFAGAADEYKSADYHFLKRQNYNSKTSPDQDSRFATGESSDERKRFFGRNKKARTKTFSENEKEFGTSDYSDSRIMGDAGNAVADDRAKNDGVSMDVDKVRSLLHGP